MEYSSLYPWIYLFLLILSNIWIIESKKFVVTDFGATPDGKTDSTEGFASAWEKACGIDGGMVSVPIGTFLVKSGNFNGPCNGETLFHIDGIVKASDAPTLNSQDYWITFFEVDGLTVSGNGVFDGNGAASWSRCHGISKCQSLPPTTLKINYVKNALIQQINLINSKMFHLIIHESDNVTVNNVHISAPEDSPNTDGIHIGDANRTTITNSYISTGDDCVSIGEGSNNVNISGVSCGPGHGISIGSLGKYEEEAGVSQITVRNCTFNGTQNGLRIKTWAPSSCSSVVSGVTFADIVIENVDNPIIIDQYYCPHGSCSREGESSVEIKGVKFVNIKGTSASDTSVSVKCSKRYPCQDIEFFGLDLTYQGQPTTALCANADQKFGGSDQTPSRCS
ncbi:hypothetical protein DH2020_025031 [Rehmannia glutinosa]|uniref:Polygalacturonase n=1 Tax=Rehmannia glutinosa TaxID=99300 RepID=A0ABR0W2M7_REHGL